MGKQKGEFGGAGDKNPAYSHGHNCRGKRSPEYSTWAGIRKRVNNKNDKLYPYYGGRGIRYDERWEDFSCFLEDVGRKPKGHSLDRIDNEGDYTKDNVRWVTQKEQNRNKRNNIYFDGAVLKDWCEDKGFSYKVVWNWYKVKGKSKEQILEDGESLWAKGQISKE